MAARSAGLILFRRDARAGVEVLLAHMGGPIWAGKDAGAWSIPKGEYGDSEEPLQAARREFAEECSVATLRRVKRPSWAKLRQPSGKRIIVWALEADMDVSRVQSNSFQMEWPPRSGLLREFPEVDRAAWFDLETARQKLVRGQVPFIDLLARHASFG